MPHVEIRPFIYNCEQCHTRCDAVSKGKYHFGNDVEFAENEEQEIISRLIKMGMNAHKCQKDGYPDIEVTDENGAVIRYIEVKAQRRTFMKVQQVLPESGLLPSETLALNLSDLRRYFEIEKATGTRISIVWVLSKRPCIVPESGKRYFGQKVALLKEVYEKNAAQRRFRRKSGKGDVVDGEHKGVVVNYHFRLAELEEWKP